MFNKMNKRKFLLVYGMVK